MNIGPDNHLGHLVFKYLKKSPDSICQIDAATGEEETYESVLSRSIRLARSLRQFGLKPGDVIALGGRNHLDIHIPFYAALFNGLPIVGVDPYFKYDEISTLLRLTKPKIAFCQSESYETYEKAAIDLGLNMKIVSFDGENSTFTKFINAYDELTEQDFTIAEFDINKIYAFLISTSGTSGKVKLAALKHKPFMVKTLGILEIVSLMKQKGVRTLSLSPVQWISSYFTTVFTPLAGDTLIQTSKPDDFEHDIEIINKYRPVSTLLSPTLMSFLLKRKDDVDLKCFKNISLAGSKVYADVLIKFKELLAKEAVVMENYGQTEMIGPVLAPNPNGPIGNCGRPTPDYAIKLVDPDTGVEINEPNVTGELWCKGLSFSEYYNEPEETALAFSEDGYYKTGDLLYRDENNNFYFVDRIKTLIKYRNSHVQPAELEDLIRSHPGVRDVCVVGVGDVLDGQRPAAAVVREEGAAVTAKEIKDLVASKLSKNKELRGGVVFLDNLLYTSTGKLARGKLTQLVEQSNRE